MSQGVSEPRNLTDLGLQSQRIKGMIPDDKIVIVVAMNEFRIAQSRRSWSIIRITVLYNYRDSYKLCIRNSKSVG